MMRPILLFFLCPAFLIAGTLGDRLGEVVRKSSPAQAIRFEVSDVSVAGFIPNHAVIRVVSPHPPIGFTSFEAVWLGEASSQRRFITALVRAVAKVAVSSAVISHGEAFGESNVRFEERELGAYVWTGFFQNAESLKQWRAKGLIRPGVMITLSNTERPILIRAGEMVKLVREQLGVTITARMRALESGRENDSIRIENPTTRKIIQGTVKGSGLVIIGGSV